MNSKVTSIIFVVLIFGIALLNLFVPKADFSEKENRYLARMPEFSVNSVFNGAFTSGWDSYVSDRFVTRDYWVGAKTLSELALGKRSTNGVYFAGDALIEMFDSVDMDRFERNISFLKSFSDRVSEGLGINVQVMLVPTASMILRDSLPAFAPEIDQQALLDYAEGELDGFIDISEILSSHSNEYIYYRTDHHWTSLGAFYAYNHLRAVIGLPEKELSDYTTETLSEEFYGTTWSKAGLYTIPPDTLTAFMSNGGLEVDYNNDELITNTIYERSYLEVKDKYSVFFNANQPVTRVKTSVDNNKKLLIIKDSYANIFAQMPLADFCEVSLLDPRFYKASFYNFIADNGITDVLVLYNLKGFSADANIYYLTT